MKKNNFAAGIILIFLGLAFFMKNYNISVINTLMLLGGLYFLYDFVTKRHQPHLIFGIILSTAGAVMLLRDIGRLRFDMSGEMFLFGLGAIFLFLYFNRGITGFVFPGYILPVFAVYALIENNMNDNYMWPSFFILLGLAFYLIYFTAFIHKNSWPLIPGTILILFGLGAFAFVLEMVSIDMIMGLQQYQNYILSACIVLIGVGLLYKGLKK
ncbi:MAG TPA: hypothetical protein VEF53_10040 [Patescibacteria group bacterium]|nr:hypothetical protein [Patescibacteria group bacterium]